MEQIGKKRRPVAVYLALAYGIAWCIWLALAAGQAMGLVTAPALAQMLVGLGMFAPIAAVAITQRLVYRRPTGVPWKVRLRGNVRWYLLAILGPATLTLLGGAVYYLVFPARFDPALGGLAAAYTPQQLQAMGGLAALQRAIPAQVLTGVFLGAFLNLVPALGEEAGWRGFLYPALQRRFGAGKGLLVGGIVWGLWHMPVTIGGHNYGTAYWGWPVLGILAMCVFCTSVGACLAWLTHKTGSIWPAALCHGAVNAIAAGPSMFLASGAQPNLLLGPNPTGLLAGLPLIALGALAARSLCRAARPAR